MRSVDRRVGSCIDLVGDLLARPTAAYPHRVISAHLHESFGCQVSWNWMDSPLKVGFDLHVPMAGWPPADLRDELVDALIHHPVMRWFLVTGDIAPMSIGRVPRTMVTARGHEVVRDHLVPIAMEEQLVVPYRFGLGEHRAFVLARGGHDFSDEDLRVTVALQPLLTLLDRQIAAYGVAPMTTYELTGRELAVIRLLAQGLTAAAIGARLSISQRTVHRHLQGAYRRLGTHDRVGAVLAAREAGLLPPVARRRLPAREP